MKKKNRIILIAIIVPLLCVLILVGHYYNNQYYAQRLISAIKAENVEKTLSLLNSPFGNVNSMPRLNIPIVTPIFNKLTESPGITTPFLEACSWGNYDVIAKFIDKGVDVNGSGTLGTSERPLQHLLYSQSSKRYDAVRLLIEHGAELGYADYSISHSQTDDSAEIVKYLESKGFRWNGYQSTLPYVCYWGDTSLIKYLIEEKNIEINSLDEEGQTGLIAYMREGMYTLHKNEAMVQFLLDHGADKTIRDNKGMTAYDYAIEQHPEWADLVKP